MIIYDGKSEQGNSGCGKSSASGGAKVIVNDTSQDISALNSAAGWD